MTFLNKQKTTSSNVIRQWASQVFILFVITSVFFPADMAEAGFFEKFSWGGAEVTSQASVGKTGGVSVAIGIDYGNGETSSYRYDYNKITGQYDLTSQFHRHEKQTTIRNPNSPSYCFDLCAYYGRKRPCMVMTPINCMNRRIKVTVPVESTTCDDKVRKCITKEKFPKINEILPGAAPGCTLTKDYLGNLVNFPGEREVKFDWSTKNASAVLLETPEGVVDLTGKPNKFAMNITSSGKHKFVLYALGKGGATSCTQDVTVSPAPVPSCTMNMLSGTLTNFPSMRKAEMNWNISNESYLKSAFLSHPKGSNPIPVMSYNGKPHPKEYSQDLTGLPSGNYTYTLTVANGQGGSGECSAEVKMKDPNPPICKELKADPEILYSYYKSTTTLHWSTDWSESTYLTTPLGRSRVPGNSTEIFELLGNHNFILEVGNVTGVGVECKQLVQVVQGPSISVDKKLVRKGDKVTVSWDPLPPNPDGTVPTGVSPNCSLSDNLANIKPILDPNKVGEVEVEVTGETTYKIICEKSGESSAVVRIAPGFQET